MVYDKIDNIDFYIGISEDIHIGLDYLRNINSFVENGVYELTPRVKAIVSEYATKENNEHGYEAHKEYIDIQYLINGKERMDYLPLDFLKETKPYNSEIDAAFYEEAGIKPYNLMLGNGYFSIFFPQDGHKPQISVDTPEIVKKIVIKVKL